MSYIDYLTMQQLSASTTRLNDLQDWFNAYVDEVVQPRRPLELLSLVCSEVW
jgi:hypothetical protein